MIPVINKDFLIDNLKIYAVLFKLHNSFLLLISDQKEMGIGNVTLGSPPLTEGLKPISASYSLFGVNKKLLSTIISEKASHTLKKPVLLLLFLRDRTKEEEIAKPLLSFVEKILTELVEKD
ncbi:MAG: hypothetical protein ACFFDK_03100 [Promethearchaeota archaeon]